MKRLNILLFVVLLASSISAQTVTELLNKAEEVDDVQLAQSLALQALDFASKSNDRASMSSAKSQIAYCLFLQGKKEEGEQMLANAFDLTQGITDPLAFTRYWNSKAVLYYFNADYKNAIQCFEKGLTYGQQLNDSYYIRNNMLSLAECHFQAKSDVKVSINYCLQGLKIPESNRPNNHKTDFLYKLGQIHYYSLGDYVKAIDYYKQAELATSKPKTKADIAVIIGKYYGDLANGTAALEYFQKALKIYEDIGDKKLIATTLIRIAWVYGLSSQFTKSIESTHRAISLINEIDTSNFNRKEALFDCYDKLAYCYAFLAKMDESRKWALQMQILSKELKTPTSEMHSLLRLAIVDFRENDKTTIDRLMAGYAIAKDLNVKDYIDQYQFYIGNYFEVSKSYSEAIPFYKEIIDRYEKERASLPDDMKLEYWSWLYGIYGSMIQSQINAMDYAGSLNSLERSTARLLLEKISTKNGKATISTIDVASWQKNVSSNQAVVCYGSLSTSPTVIVVDASTMGGIEIRKKMWISSIKNRYSMPVANNFEKLRAFKKIESKQKESSSKLENIAKVEAENDEIGTIISQYRFLLSKPLKTQQEKETIDFLGRRFYQLLVLPIEEKLVGKTELLIIPNDQMAFLPFEAFIMPDGRYLVEKYDIRYLPSLSVGNELSNRKYSDNRKPILAFGNAIYSSSSSAMDDRGFKNISSENSDANTPPNSEFIELMKGMGLASKEGKSMKKYYEALGIGWGNLLGTLAELDAISGLVPSAVCIKGKDVNEQSIKQMSTNGQLKGYKILHFATHGIVIPEYQELSAIVLSQDQPNEDGYLRASEIANLNLNADFVNLSACETGLGKIYGGEGVVGLTQSFLLAGANSIAVSLWKVSDQSTMEFQKEFYRLVFVEKMPISKALNQVKRTFIKGLNNQPFYWAPFVYYGM